MSLKVTTPTGISDVVDLKVKAADGTFVDMQRLVVKTDGGTFETVWEREPPPPKPLILTVNAHDGEFIIPIYGEGNKKRVVDWIVDWGDNIIAPVRTRPNAIHSYATPGTYQIKIYPATEAAAQTATATAWLLPFGFSAYDDIRSAPATGQDSMANRQKIIHVDGVLVPEMFGTASQLAGGKIGNDACNHWFCGCTNLEMSDTFTFSGWENITEVGGSFCYGMFKFCTNNNFTMGSAFNLPQNVQTIRINTNRDNHYHNSDQIPAYAFCNSMFHGCNGSSFNMNDIFTLPQTLIMTGAWFCTGMFWGCRGDAFTMGQAFNLPQHVTRMQAPDVPDEMYGHVFENMFRNCRGAAFTMNEIFQTPQNLEHGWVQTFARMFFHCRGDAFTMNDIFTLPQNMQKAYTGLAYQMFQNCSGDAFTMNSVFNAPPSIVFTASGHNLGLMCSGCNGTAFQVNDAFVLPTVPQSHLNTTYEADGTTVRSWGSYYHTFADITNVQNRTATSIIGMNPVPLAPREAFGTGFTDWSSIDVNWQG